MTTSCPEGAAILDLARSRGHLPRLVGLGEPLHLVDDLLRLRNDVFRHLVEHAGFRTLALESDAWAGRVLDAWVHGGPGDVADVLVRGFSPYFGRSPLDRELLEWARGYNDGRPPGEQVRVTGFDAPTELMWAHSPRAMLAHLHRYLDEHSVPTCAWDTLDALLGPDGPWTDEAAAMDPARSVGSEDRVRELRVLADDLARTLTIEAPALLDSTGRDAFDDAALAARTATGLLAYHATMADPGDGERRWSRGAGLRDAMMADNLEALAARGPTLAFAHNQHVRTGTARMMLGPMALRWQPAGAHLADRLGPDYLPVGIAVGRAEHLGLPEPEADTLEGGMWASGDRLLDPRSLPRGRPLRTWDNPGYFPLDEAALDELDAVLFVRDLPVA